MLFDLILPFAAGFLVAWFIPSPTWIVKALGSKRS